MAYAGAGKTTTLKLLAQSTTRRGCYLAFNRSIAAEAATKFPRTVSCSTVHSVAFNVVRTRYGLHVGRLTTTPNANVIAKILGLSDEIHLTRNFSLSPRSYSSMVLSAVRQFTQSADHQITDSHVRQHGRFSGFTREKFEPVVARVLSDARHVWSLMCSPSRDIPIGHDGYVKLWALSHPRIAEDFVLLDEAQDSNPVLLDVLSQQKCQLVYVGDPFQQIYEWRGAVNAMDSMKSDHRATLTQSFRFGNAIANSAFKIIKTIGAKDVLIGNSHIDSAVSLVTNPCVIISRGNAGVMSNLLVLLVSGMRCHVLGGVGELKKLLESVSRLKNGMRSDLPEFFGFDCWNDVVEHSESEDGQELRTFVKLVQTFGENVMLRALVKCQDNEAQADITLTTAHKAKGREWESVRVDSDFDKSLMKLQTILLQHPKTKDDFIEQDRARITLAAETRLVYVAITRATTAVELPSSVKSVFGIKNTSSIPFSQSGQTTADMFANTDLDTDLIRRLQAALA